MTKIKIAQLLLVLFFPIMIILSNLLVLTYNNNTYSSIYKKENVYQRFQSTGRVDNVTKELTGYFRGQNNLEDNFFSYQAKIHLQDVMSLLNLALRTNYFSIAVIMIMIFFLLKYKKYKLLKRSIVIGSSITIFVVIIFGTLLALNFSFFFIKFHEILFRNNFWLFDEGDNLIKIFPQEFFIAFAYKIFINISLTVFAFVLAAMLFIKDDKSTN